MARLPRIVISGIPHHITQRGNRRQTTFFSDEDRAFYLNTLAENTRKNGVSIWAYCLMDNHVHIVAVPQDEHCLAKALGDTHRIYTRRIHFRKNWRGYFWQGRFSSCPMDDAHLYAAVRYVERNPVRAGMVKHAEEYQWSSAKAHVFNLYDHCLSGDERTILAIDDWKSYLMSPDDENHLKNLRLGANTGRPMGDDAFLDKLESLTGRIFKKKRPGQKATN